MLLLHYRPEDRSRYYPVRMIPYPNNHHKSAYTSEQPGGRDVRYDCFQQTILNYQNTVLNAAREVEDAMETLAQTRLEAE